jgi:hypothetical protein
VRADRNLHPTEGNTLLLLLLLLPKMAVCIGALVNKDYHEI